MTFGVWAHAEPDEEVERIRRCEARRTARDAKREQQRRDLLFGMIRAEIERGPLIKMPPWPLRDRLEREGPSFLADAFGQWHEV